MTTRVASWQGSLRSTGNVAAAVGNNANAGNVEPQSLLAKAVAGTKRVVKGGPLTRSALGDISNKNPAGSGLGFRITTKKAAGSSKPFAVAGFEDSKSENDVAMMVVDETACPHLPKATEECCIHSEPIPEVDRADINDLHNPKYAAEYVNDIYKHYHKTETKYMPPANYMDSQTDINSKMRALLIDWLVQVHLKFELLPQTLYLTVNVLDRYLALKVVPRRKLQLVGCAAMLLASKYEEIYAPECQDFVSMSDKAFTVDELLRMESTMLNSLGFHLTTPSPYTFLRRYMKVACSSAKTQHFATYLIERSLQEYEMLEYKPSLLAAAALYIAQGLTDERRGWSAVHVRHSGYEESDLESCVENVKRLYSCNLKNYLQAVSKKYASSKYMHVAMISIA